MGFMKDIRKSFSGSGDEEIKRSDRTEMSMNNLVDFLNLRGVNQNDLSEATYFACMKVLSETVGKLPLKLYQSTAEYGVRPATDHPLYNLITRRPNTHMTASVFWSTVEFNRNHYGNAYVAILGEGTKTQLVILPSDKVTVIYDNTKLIDGNNPVHYMINNLSDPLVLPSDQVMHFKSYNTFNGLVGISVREQLATTLRGNKESQELLNSLYESGFTSKAVLQYTGELSKEKLDSFTKGIENYATGKVNGIKNFLPIPAGTEVKTLDTKLVDNQFIELRRFGALQIASAFGIKPYQIGDYTKSSYASAEAQQLAFYVDTLLYILKQYEEEITEKLIPISDINSGHYAKFNVGVILRADSKTQIETMAKAVSTFLYTPNEARQYLDKHAVDGGDVLIGNGASIPISMVGQQYLAKEQRVTEVDTTGARKEEDHE